MGYVPPRDAQGRIIIGPLPTALLDEEEPAAPAAPAAPAPARTPPPPPRRPGDTPTAFDQLRPGPPAPARPAAAWSSYAAAALVVALLGLAVWSLRGQLAPAAPPAAAEAAPTTASAAPTGTAWPALSAALIAYDSPGGQLLGALEPGRPYLVVGRSGDEWLQLDVGAPEAPNLVWVKRFLVELPAGLTDLATPTPLPPSPAPTPRPYVAPAPAYVPLPDPAYVAPSPIPQATCKAVILDGSEIGQACGYNQAEIMATHAALLSTPRGGVPVLVTTATPIDVSTFPTARP